MKKIILPAIMLITTSAFVRATSPEAETKNLSSEKRNEKKSQPNNVVVINIEHLREKTKAVSLLKPVFTIASAIENTAEKFHGRKLKITCNKSADKRD
jgi:hypothetical protein